jgi:hypothetical protein
MKDRNAATAATSGSMPPARYPLRYVADDSSVTAFDYTLAYALDCTDNVGAEAVVQKKLPLVAPELSGRVFFDSDPACFFAYVDALEDFELLAEVVATAVAERHPNAIPGDATCSPTYERHWDLLTIKN